MFSNTSKPGAATYRRRAMMIVEAAQSGMEIAQRADHKHMAREFRSTLAWGQSILRDIENGKATK